MSASERLHWVRRLLARKVARGSQPGPDSGRAEACTAANPPLASSAIAFVRMQSLGGDFLSLPDHTETLSRTRTLDPAHAAIGIVPHAMPHICLIAAQDGRRFHIEGDTIKGIATSARMLRSTRRGVVRFKQPLGGSRFLAVDEAVAGAVRFDSPGTTMEAAFALLPVEASEVTDRLRDIAAMFGALAAEGFCEATLVARLRAGTLPADLAEAVLRLLPREDLSELSRRLLNEPALLARTKNLLPGNVFLHTWLPALAEWQQSRAPVPGGCAQSGQAEEALLLPSTNTTCLPLGVALLTLARTHVAPRRGFCVLASARNEGPYVLDWIAYHLSIGFEHVFLYTNDNDDGSDALLGKLAQHGVITLVRNVRAEMIGVQERAYAHALTLLPQILDYRWTAVLDIDEYFAFDTSMFDGVADFVALHEAQPVDAVALCWLIFAANLGDAYADEPTTQRFTWRAVDVNTHVKSLFRTRLFWHSQPHYPHPTMERSFYYRAQDGGIHHHPGVTDRIPAFSPRPAAEQGWINHYLLRTAPEALWKLNRGSAAWLSGEDDQQRPGYAEFIAKTFLDLARPEGLVMDQRIGNCAHRQPAMMEKLLALPGVAESDSAIKSAFSGRLKDLCTQFLAQPAQGLSPALLRFRDAVAASQGMRAQTVLRPGTRMI